MRRLLFLCLFCLMAMGCETEGLAFGFKAPTQHISATMTGVSLSWPAMIAAGVVVWLVARITGRKNRKGGE